MFAVDRAGLVGKDGATHQGIFDLSYLSSIPNLTVMAPKNKWELSDMLKYAIAAEEPVAIRYPRGEACDLWKDQRAPIQKGCAEVLAEGTYAALFAIGSMVETAWQVRKKLAEKGIPTTVVNARFAMPLDKNCLRKLAESHPLLVTMEENVASGGFGEHVAAFLEEEACIQRSSGLQFLTLCGTWKCWRIKKSTGTGCRFRDGKNISRITGGIMKERLDVLLVKRVWHHRGKRQRP